MRKPLGFTTIGGVHYCRLRVPNDLLASYGGRREIKVSLRTRDFAEGRRLCIFEAANLERKFAERRALLQRANTNSLSLTAVEDLVRSFVECEDAREVERFSDFDFEDYSQRDQALTEQKSQAVELMNANSPATQELVSRTAQDILQHTDGLRCVAKADRTAAFDIVRRGLLELERRGIARLKQKFSSKSFDRLFASNSPAGRPAQNPTDLITLAELVELYRADYAKSRSRTIRQQKVSASLALILRFFGSNVTIKQIDPIRCTEFRDMLNELPANLTKQFHDNTVPLAQIAADTRKRGLKRLAHGTQEGYLNTLKSLFSWAQGKWLLDRNPALNLYPLASQVHRAKRRHPFTPSELRSIFDSEFYRTIGNTRAVSQASSRYWIPLIAAYTGMRLNEICQLHVSDIRISANGTEFISINREHDKVLKNEYSEREVPIHSELVRLGFLEYVATARKSGAMRLFPDLRYHPKGNYGPDISKWFNRFLKREIPGIERASFHSFRHSFSDALRLINTPQHIAAYVGGWRMEKGSQGDYGGRAFNADNVAEWINRIRYDGLEQ